MLEEVTAYPILSSIVAAKTEPVEMSTSQLLWSFVKVMLLITGPPEIEIWSTTWQTIISIDTADDEVTPSTVAVS